MKKILACFAAASLALGMSATNYVVLSHDALAPGEELLPTNYYEWEGTYSSATVDDADSPEGKASVWTINNDGWFGGGWNVQKADYDITPIVNGDYDIVFSLKTDIPASTVLQLQYGGQNLAFDAVRDGAWHEVRLNVASFIPENLRDAMLAANDAYVFAVVGGAGAAGKTLSLADIRFEAARPVPAISATVSDITMSGASIAYDVTLPEALEGAEVSVTLNGQTYTESPIVLTGLEAGKQYSYSLEVAALKDGETYTAATPVAFATLRDPSNTPMWYGHSEVDTKNDNMEQAVHLTFDYTMIANADNTLTIEAIVGGDYQSLPGLAGFQINILGEANEWGDSMLPDENGMISRTTARTFTDGEQVTGFFWVPYALKGERVDFAEPYKYGSENEKPVTAIKPRLTASVEDITTTGASIVYSVDMPAELAGAELKVLLNGETELSESPYILSGLTENTQYDYTIQAIATLGGETYESLEQPLSFKTLRDGAKAVSNYQIINGMMPNNYKVGETEADRRPLPVSMLTELVYNTDQTVTVNFSVAGADQIVGFVPEVNIGGQWSGSLAGKAVDGVYSWTTPNPFDEGTNLHSYFWFQFPGGVQGIDMIDFILGEGNEPVAYGEVAGVVLTAKVTDVVANVATPVTYYAVDAAGNYLLNEEIALDVKEGEAAIYGDFVTLPGRGTAVIEAVCGDFSAELTFTCLTSADATNVAKGILGVASEAATTDPANATDDNEGSQLEFSCADTEEHSFALDLGKNHDIEVIEVVFEGASATQYTITVERETPDAPAARAKAESKVYEVTDGQGGAGVTARKQFVEETPIVGRYVTLNTSKAFDKTWGIKLKELRVLGKESFNTTGIESVELEAAAPARYFRLDGIEVPTEQLSAGVYVKLQGNTASKIVVR